MEQKKKTKNDREMVSLDCKCRGYSGLMKSVLHDRYKFIEELSRGTFGRVYKIEDTKNKRFLAIKLQDDQEMTSHEIATMNKIAMVFDANSASELS